MKQQPGKSFAVFTVAVILLLLPILYVLSAGPALRLAIRSTARPGPDDERPMKVFHVLYDPLFTAAKATGTDGFLREYVLLWE